MASPQQQAAAIIGAQYAPIDYAMVRAAQQTAKEQAALQQARKALVQQLQAGVRPAGQAYDAAIGQQQALAQAGADLLSRLNPNAEVQASLAGINAPQGQRQALANQMQAQFPGQGGVLNIEQGTIPGASLAAQKAAQQQFLAGLPTVAALAGEQSLRGLLARAAESRDKLLEQRLAAAGRIPELALTIANQRAAAAQAESAGASKQIIGSSESGYFLVDPETGQKQRLTKPSPSAVAAANAPPEPLVRNVGGNLVQYNPKTGRWDVAVKGGGGKSGGGLTPNTRQRLAQDAFGFAQEAYQGKDADGNKIDQRPSVALNDLIGQGVPFDIAIKAIQRIARRPDVKNNNTRIVDAHGNETTVGALWRATLKWTK